MKDSIRRQLTDIQSRADQLINGSPSIDDIEEFDQYCQELKTYLQENVTEEEIVTRVNQIPNILEEDNNEKVTRGILVSILLFFSGAAASYLEDRKRIENAKGNIHHAKGLFSSIEFLSRNIE